MLFRSILFVIFFIPLGGSISDFIYVIFFIPLGDLISAILFMLYCFSYLYLFGDICLNYSIVSHEAIILEYYADW